jgi:hypothetical protein
MVSQIYQISIRGYFLIENLFKYIYIFYGWSLKQLKVLKQFKKILCTRSRKRGLGPQPHCLLCGTPKLGYSRHSTTKTHQSKN